MPTKLPRCYVTLPPELWDLVSEFRDKFGCMSMSSAIRSLVARGLMDYKPLMRSEDK